MTDYDAPDTAAAVYTELGVWDGVGHEVDEVVDV
jgi:hypothetical protein